MINSNINYDKDSVSLGTILQSQANRGDGVFAYNIYTRTKAEWVAHIISTDNSENIGSPFKYNNSGTHSILNTGMIVNCGGMSIGTVPTTDYYG